MDGKGREGAPSSAHVPLHGEGAGARRCSLPTAAVRAYAIMQAVGVSLLPVIVAAHADAARCFEQSLEALDAGQSESSWEQFQAGAALLNLLKRSVLPVGGWSGDLLRIYDFLSGELERVTPSEGARDVLPLACATMRSLGAAWQSRLGRSEQG